MNDMYEEKQVFIPYGHKCIVCGGDTIIGAYTMDKYDPYFIVENIQLTIITKCKKCEYEICFHVLGEKFSKIEDNNKVKELYYKKMITAINRLGLQSLPEKLESLL